MTVLLLLMNGYLARRVVPERGNDASMHSSLSLCILEGELLQTSLVVPGECLQCSVCEIGLEIRAALRNVAKSIFFGDFSEVAFQQGENWFPKVLVTSTLVHMVWTSPRMIGTLSLIVKKQSNFGKELAYGRIWKARSWKLTVSKIYYSALSLIYQMTSSANFQWFYGPFGKTEMRRFGTILIFLQQHQYLYPTSFIQNGLMLEERAITFPPSPLNKFTEHGSPLHWDISPAM